MAVGVVLKDRLAIVADGCQLDALLLESWFGILQLDELRFAERSPIGGAEEQQDCAVRPFQRGVGLVAVKLIAQRKSRRLRPDGKTNGGSRGLLARRWLLRKPHSQDAE